MLMLELTHRKGIHLAQPAVPTRKSLAVASGMTLWSRKLNGVEDHELKVRRFQKGETQNAVKEASGRLGSVSPRMLHQIIMADYRTIALSWR